MKINVSESNGHPTRKFRNIRFTNTPLAVGDADTELYTFEGFSVRLPKIMDCYTTFYAETVKQIKEHRKNGISEKDMCESNISKTKAKKMKIQLLASSFNITWEQPANRKVLMGEYIEFAHGVITCAYLGAVSWGEKFGILLPDGTMPLVPEEEIGMVCRQIAELARADIAKSEAEKKTTPPPAPPAEKKFTDLFTTESIKAGDAEFDYFIGKIVEDGCDHDTVERFHDIFHDCKNWATGEKDINVNMNFTFDAKKTNQKRFEEMIEMYYSKVRIFCFLLSTYNKGKGLTKEGQADFELFIDDLPKNGFHIVRQLVMDDKERVGYVGVFSNKQWNALANMTPDAETMYRYEKQPKGAKLCCCGCGTFQKKLLKATCCGARYVNAEHQKEHWAEHKQVCKKTGLPPK
jgi:hypothetical protein